MSKSDVDVVVVGAGFAGMYLLKRLRDAGFSHRVLEAGDDVGGTWYWNRYPNCACDVESYVYLPLLEETGYMPTEKYVKAYEIFAYCQLLGRTLDLYPRALFQTEVDDMRWDDTTQRWHTITSRGDDLTSKFVIIAGGVLHRPKLPAVEGIHKFKGRAFHTSRWDYSYTGGSPTEFMDKLADKRVAIIGTGATAVQAVPKLAEACKELYVFQRTPALVGKRNNKPTDPEWFASLKPGWQAERIKNFTLAITGSQPEVDMVADEWTKLFWVDTRKLPDDEQEAIELEKVDFDNVQKIRDHIANVITDQELAKKLMPWYSQACKRPCFHDEYLPAFNRSNVHLVDTDGKGIHELGENGPIFEGREYPVDLLIYASGYEVTNDYHERLGFDPKGRGGTPLSVAWADGPSTLQGVLTRGFPNMLMISTVQGAQATNFLHSISTVAEHVAFTKRHGNDVVVVVSAMGKSTDNLIKLANDVSSTQPAREMDMLLTTGERISMALVCMALADLGIEAVSFTGSQVGIITDTVHTKAKILEVKGDRAREALAQGKVCVVAGFQGVSTEREITTLGRGGSDTTAVALAAALNADSCEIYTDVTGVFSADPRMHAEDGLHPSAAMYRLWAEALICTGKFGRL